MKKVLLTIQEASAYLGVSANTLRRWEEAGTVTPIRTVGNQRRYRLEDIKHLKRRQRIQKIRRELRAETISEQQPVHIEPQINGLNESGGKEFVTVEPFQHVAYTPVPQILLEPEPLQPEEPEYAQPERSRSRIS